MRGKSFRASIEKLLATSVRRISAVGAALSLSACVGGPEPFELEPGEARAGVIGGADSPALRDAVVFLRAVRADATWNDCSGTLVAPSVVVTARHCVTHVHPGNFVCRGNGELMQDGTGAGVFGADVEPSDIEVHTGAAPLDAVAARGAAIFTTGSESACRDDVAVVVLDRPIELPAYAPLRSLRETRVGERVRLVGYGPGERAGLIARREVTNARVVDVAGPDAAADAASATTPRRSLVVAGNTLCSGDSGGPALAMDTGALVGVYSRVTGDCFAVESRNTFMLAQGFTSLFDAAFAAAGEAPEPEPEPGDPAGVGGAGGNAGESARGNAGETATAEGGAAAEPVDDRAPRESSGAFRCSVREPRTGSSPRTASAIGALLVALALSRRSSRRAASSAG